MRPFLRDTRGAALMEFAIVAPVLLTMIVGGLGAGHTLYVQSVLDGEMQKAARDMSLEDASAEARQAAIEDRVRDQVHKLVKGADVDFELTAYHDYRDADAKVEEYVDGNHDGTCNKGESYVDANNNNSWDREGGTTGIGGSKDVVLLKAIVSYASFLPFGQTRGQMNLTSTTLLRNQPSSDQAAAPLRTCA
ncbi:pilus assembly protein [Sphingomonas ginsenosidivorax]|uniref:Pilus assembly protein n=1 Tax=Sphingomonas ginsenosidivorax TaxID=862135 RepID=A0A5C6UIW5_9SPHN|nr:TadE/TadG family type IV pilus assembly protein [Sphingomonas ginsenosidivorax]TXC71222.1 pilus assembly protein [Sphingomonas ginsenosidivorax]TXC72166.1 pilus assembly protein [Sphingomonas ginsenosidivorax]